MAEPDGSDYPDSPNSPDPLDVLLTKPARSGRTGQRPFGSLGDQIQAPAPAALRLSLAQQPPSTIHVSGGEVRRAAQSEGC